MIETLVPCGTAEEDGLVLPVLRSEVLPAAFPHGFTTRAGGVSDGVFASLNLGARWGDDPARVAANRARLHAAAARPLLAFATQVHGADVHEVKEADSAESIAAARADAVMARGGAVAVGVHMADCGPLLVADVRTGAFAAVHAGWRGTVAGVLPSALGAMSRAYGSRAEDLRVAIGPCIGPCCFEVGPEVVDAVLAAFPWADDEGLVLRSASHGKPHVDLSGLNAAQARRAGVPTQAIDPCGLCTSCDPARFYSYRRDKGVTGLHAAFISGPAEDASGVLR